MISLLDRLLAGDRDLPETFKKVNDFWQQFHEEHASSSVEQIAKDLGMKQHTYELAFRDFDRHFAKSMMGPTAIAAIYDVHEGFGDSLDYAVRVAKAFAKSQVSIECKSSAKMAIKMYHLDDEESGLAA